MNIKEQLNDFVTYLHSKEGVQLRLVAKASELMANLQYESAIVPENVMQGLDNETQKMILIAFLCKMLEYTKEK